ncbi:carboxypeptidase-like regulatory domain-containing protein [Petrimonas sulfuriphila]|uniref:carboxypeptidase-like regulatory domain-containing protein n=1 Tax=Petrimonas sulfuriphila TaxID=285070 RepID=UPI003EBFDA74
MNLKDYIHGKRYGKEANRLEREAMNDPFLQDTIDGYDSVPGNHVEAIEKLEKRFAPQPKHIDKRVWLWAAAAVLVLLIGLPFLLRQPDTKDVQVASVESLKKEETTLSPKRDSLLVANHTPPKTAEERTATTVQKKVEVRVKEVQQAVEAEKTAEIVSEEILQLQAPERMAEAIEPEQVSVARAALPKQKAIQGKVAAVTAVSPNTKTISGKIVDEIGEPIIGATVNVKNTHLGAVTDMDGKFRLTVPEDEKGMLVASFIGMKNVEMPLKEHLGDVVMKSNDMALDEVVVVAFGTQKNESIVGSASTVKDPAPVFGEAEFRHYFEKNHDKTVCPDEPISIKVEFYVNGQGRPGSIAIKENSCQKLETEIKRLLLGSPPWSERNRKVTLNWTLNE